MNDRLRAQAEARLAGLAIVTLFPPLDNVHGSEYALKSLYFTSWREISCLML